MAADPTRHLSSQALNLPSPAELALCRVTVADRARDADDAALLLDLLGLGLDAGPRVRLAALTPEERVDLHVRRDPAAPLATAPVDAAVLRARKAARARRYEAAKTHLRAQGLSGRQLSAALSRMGV